MRNGYKVTLGILTVMILITLTVGTSYSYYSVSDMQTTPNELATTCFNITFNDNSGNTRINLTNTYPMSEATAITGRKVTPYTFTIANTCTSENSPKDTNYVIFVNTAQATVGTNLTSYIKYKLNQTLPSTLEGTSANLVSQTYPLNSNVATNYNTNYQLATGTLAPGATKTYQLYMWLDESACSGGTLGESDCEANVMGKSFVGDVLVYSYM